MYEPGEERTGLVGGTGGPWVGCETGALMSRRIGKHNNTVGWYERDHYVTFAIIERNCDESSDEGEIPLL